MGKTGLARGLVDDWGRRLDTLHLSVWGACNMRCLCCTSSVTPPELALDDLHRIVVAAAGLGFTRVRLTGGEPLLRPDVVELVQVLGTVPGISEVALTTNGTLLAELAQPLAQAGLKRLNIRLDSRNPETYRRLTGEERLLDVWRGLAAAEEAGLHRLRINAVVRRGCNDGEIGDLADLTCRNAWQVRFLEYPPLRGANWQSWHVPMAEIKRKLWQLGDLEPVTSPGIADLYHIPLALGTVGLLGWQDCAGCVRCSRLHVTVEGRAHGCVFDRSGVDLRPGLRDPERLQALLRKAVRLKPAQRPALPAAEPFRRRFGG